MSKFHFPNHHCANRPTNSSSFLTHQFALRGDGGRPDVPLQDHAVPGARAEHVAVPGEGADARRVTLEAVDSFARRDVPNLEEKAIVFFLVQASWEMGEAMPRGCSESSIFETPFRRPSYPVFRHTCYSCRGCTREMKRDLWCTNWSTNNVGAQVLTADALYNSRYINKN